MKLALRNVGKCTKYLRADEPRNFPTASLLWMRKKVPLAVGQTFSFRRRAKGSVDPTIRTST